MCRQIIINCICHSKFLICRFVTNMCCRNDRLTLSWKGLFICNASTSVRSTEDWQVVAHIVCDWVIQCAVIYHVLMHLQYHQTASLLCCSSREGHLCGNTAVPVGIPREWILKCSLIPRDGREWLCYCREQSGVVLLAFPRKWTEPCLNVPTT